ncbi:MAG TPA: hypothetical protein VGC25_02910 [Alphaproteobacteria bacterium]
MWGDKRYRATGGTRGYGAHVSEAMIQAYVDDMLPPRQRLEVEEFLATHPEEARRVADFRAQNRGFHELYDHYLSEPLPDPVRLLEERILRRLAGRRNIRALARVAATLAIAMAAAAGGWYGSRHLPSPDREIDFAALSGKAADVLNPDGQAADGGDVRRAKAGSERSAGKDPDGATESTAPDLRRFGFNLVGSRQLGKGGGRGGQLTYESRQGIQVVLYFSPAAGNGRQKISLTEQGPVSILVWNRDGRAYTMFGEVGRDTMLAMGAAVNARWVEPPAPEAKPEGRAPAGEPAPPDGKGGIPKDDKATNLPGEGPIRPAASRDEATAAQGTRPDR